MMSFCETESWPTDTRRVFVCVCVCFVHFKGTLPLFNRIIFEFLILCFVLNLLNSQTPLLRNANLMRHFAAVVSVCHRRHAVMGRETARMALMNWAAVSTVYWHLFVLWCERSYFAGYCKMIHIKCAHLKICRVTWDIHGFYSELQPFLQEMFKCRLLLV